MKEKDQFSFNVGLIALVDPYLAKKELVILLLIV